VLVGCATWPDATLGRVRTWGELVGLAADAGRLWWRFLPRLLLFHWCGVALHRVFLQTAAGFGANAKVTANLFFAMALVATASGTIFMIHALGPGLAHFRARVAAYRATPPADPPPPEPPANPAVDPVVPADVAAWRTGLQTLSVTIGPFLAIASVWGLVEAELRNLLVLNAKNYGTTARSAWSFDLTDVGFFVMLAAATYLTRALVLWYAAARRRARRRAGRSGHTGGSLGLAFGSVYLEGLYVYLFFVVALVLLRRLRDWLGDRVLAHWLADAWHWLTGLLPRILDIDLPEVVRAAGRWIVEVLVPAGNVGVLLPLLWLALTANVFGWRDLRLRDLMALPAVARYAARLRPDGTLPLTGRLVKSATGDLRTKYLPVLTSLRMLLRAGPRLLGAYLVLVTAVSAVGGLLGSLARVLVGPVDPDRWAQTQPFVDLAIGTVVAPLLVAIYGAAFDRCLSLVPEEAVSVRLQRVD